MFCTQCGTENRDGARFCKKCGAPLPSLSDLTQPAIPDQPAVTDAPGPAPAAAPANNASASNVAPVSYTPANDAYDNSAPATTNNVPAAPAVGKLGRLLPVLVGIIVAVVAIVIALVLQNRPGAGSSTAASGSADAQVAGSSDGSASEGSDASDDAASDAAPALTDEQKMYIAYGNILDNANSLDYFQNSDAYSINGYRYFLTDMTGTGTPSLVLVQAYDPDRKVEVYDACVFTYDPATGEAPQNTGVDLNWGYRVNGFLDASGVGITTSQPSDANHTIHYVVRDGALVAQDGAGTPGGDITLCDVNDRSLIGGAVNGTLPGTDVQPDVEAGIAQAQADGLDVYQGTARILTGHELLELNGLTEYEDNFLDEEINGTYAILVFDSLTGVTCKEMGEYYRITTKEVPLICFDESHIAQLQPYDGKTVTVAIDPEDTYYPGGMQIYTDGVFSYALRVLG